MAVNDRSDISPENGEAFLELLDNAMAGRSVSGVHAETARFGAAAARAVNPSAAAERADPGLRQRIEGRLRQPVPNESGAVHSIQRWMKRWRLGVLDMAALLILGVLLAVLCDSFLGEPAPPARKNETVAADGDENKSAPVPVPVPAPVPVTEPTPLPAPEPWEKEIHEKLAVHASFDFKDTPLPEVLARIGEAAKQKIDFDPQVLERGADKQPVTLKVVDMQLEQVLTWVCRLADLHVMLKDRAVTLATRDVEAAFNVKLVMYPVAGMFNTGTMTSLLFNRVFPAEFVEPETSIAADDGKLVVMQRRAAHEKIAAMIGELRKNFAEREINLTPAKAPEAAWSKDIKTKLEKKISFDFVDKSFDDAIDTLREHSGVTIIVNAKVLAAGIPNLNLHVTDMTQDLALDWVLKLAGLEKNLRDGAVYISTPDARQNEGIQAVVYDVKNLTDVPDAIGTVAAIADSIRQKVDPSQWDAALGTSMEEMEGRLLIFQRPAMHKKIRRHLKKLQDQVLSKMH